jgi:type II secretory pathway pseudopilin PulG
MARRGITLVEMLVAMAITLVMMAAVVTVFANVTSSVQSRRAGIELGSQIRHVRAVLERDLTGATCPTLPWQRPESNHGYLEIIEGPHSDIFPSMLTDGIDSEAAHNHELDPGLSLVPRYGDSLEDLAATNVNIKAYGGTLVQRVDPDNPNSAVVSTLNGLGDYDDVLALTVRNEEEPFTGNVPDESTVRFNSTAAAGFVDWTSKVIESPLAEVVWFAIENPEDHDDESGFFGEPGLRTIYRRTLLIAPWVAPYRYVDPETGALVDTYREGSSVIRTEPGVLRVLWDDVEVDEPADALAALVAFQDRFDLSARVEWDPRLGEDGRWKIVANTLSDLTKRENRFEHHYYLVADDSRRIFPFAMVSSGGGYSGDTESVTFFSDTELDDPADDGTKAVAQAVTQQFSLSALSNLDRYVQNYVIDPANTSPSAANTYLTRPFAFVQAESSTGTPATARAILNDEGQVVHVVHGPVPLWGRRRGEDVMLTDALAFDLRVFDPGAPVFQEPVSETIVSPGDPWWPTAYATDLADENDFIGDNSAQSFVRYVGQGAFVDLGYGLLPQGPLLTPVFKPGLTNISPWFFDPRWTPNRSGAALAPGYSVYDTWSFHYENNGVDEDDDGAVDEGTNGFDDMGVYVNTAGAIVTDIRNGIDDIGERETTPPYDRPLRGIQIRLRGFERDSQQIREVTVNQHFLPE